MKFKTQKPVFFAVAAILVFFLFTCKPFDSGNYDESGGGFVYTDVEYSPDGKSITIYLDGSAPVLQSRALNLKNAILGHDLFEVAFYHANTGTIARAMWEKGHAAGVSGVARGVDYRYATVPAAAAPTAVANAGAAILFVGKKSDRTLLGLGRLTGTDDPANGGATFISANTKSVTFSVAALSAGTNITISKSSFLTAAMGNSYTTVQESYTDITALRVGGRVFPLYRFNNKPTARDGNVYAHYTFNVSGDSFDTYHEGILQAAPPSLATLDSSYRLDPRYARGDGTWEKGLTGVTKDTSTTVAFRGNSDGNVRNNLSFNNPVLFNLYITTANSGKVFAFSFQVPVYPLYNDGRGSSNPWYIRPGYDSYLYDLDDGEGGTGGAILIGTREMPANVALRLEVKPAPNKYMYPTPGSTPPNYDFDLNGIVVNIMLGDSPRETVLSIPPSTAVTNDVRFYLGKPSVANGGSLPETRIYQNDSIKPILDAHPEYIENGMVNVYVEYFDPNTQSPGDPTATPPVPPEPPYMAVFTIYLFTGSTPDPSNIPAANRYVIASQLDLVQFGNRLNTTPGNYVAVFYDSFNLPQINPNQPFFVVILAGAPGLTIGRSDPDAVFRIQNASSNSSIYLGVWPFNDTVAVGGQAVVGYPFQINSQGTVAQPNQHAASGYFVDYNNRPATVILGPGFIVNGTRFEGNKPP